MKSDLEEIKKLLNEIKESLDDKKEKNKTPFLNEVSTGFFVTLMLIILILVIYNTIAIIF